MTPNTEKFSLVSKNDDAALSGYKQFCDEQRHSKQTPKDMVLNRGTQSEEEPQAGLSGEVPEAGVVTAADDSFIFTKGYGDPPVVQGVAGEEMVPNLCRPRLTLVLLISF